MTASVARRRANFARKVAFAYKTSSVPSLEIAPTGIKVNSCAKLPLSGLQGNIAIDLNGLDRGDLGDASGVYDPPLLMLVVFMSIKRHFPIVQFASIARHSQAPVGYQNPGIGGDGDQSVTIGQLRPA
jgi:hypothetical protein